MLCLCDTTRLSMPTEPDKNEPRRQTLSSQRTRHSSEQPEMKFVLLALLLLACGSVATKAQSCVTQEDVRQMLARVEAPAPASPDKKLKEELLKMFAKQRELLMQVVEKDQAKQSE